MVQTNKNSKVILAKKVKKTQKTEKLPKNPFTKVNVERNKENNPVNNVRIKTQVLVAPYFTKCIVHIIHYTHYNIRITHTKIEIGWYKKAKLVPDSIIAAKGANQAQNKPYSPPTRSLTRSIGKNIGPNSYKSVLAQYIILSTLATLLLTIITDLKINTGIFVNHGKSGKNGKNNVRSNKGNKQGNGNSHDIAIYQQIHTLEAIKTDTEAVLVTITRIVTHFTLILVLTPKINVVMSSGSNKLGERPIPAPAPAVLTVPTYTWSSLSWSVAWLKGWGEQVNAELQIWDTRLPGPPPLPRPLPGPPEPRVLHLDVGDLVGRVGDLEGEQVSDLEFPDPLPDPLPDPPLDPLPDPPPDPEGSWDLEGRWTESEAQTARTESGAENLKKTKQMGKSQKIINYNNFMQYMLPQFYKSLCNLMEKTKANLSQILPVKYLAQEGVFLPQDLGEVTQNQVISAERVVKRKDRSIKLITSTPLTPTPQPSIHSVSRHKGCSTRPKTKRPKR